MFATILLSILLHPIHVSISNIEYNPSMQCFEVAIKIYKDDFETILNKTYSIKTNLGLENEHTQVNDYIMQYINNKLFVFINNKKCTMTFKEKKITDDSVWLYFDINSLNQKKIKTIVIENTLMFDLYDDQSNLVIFTYNTIQKGIKFNKENYKEIIEMNTNR